MRSHARVQFAAGRAPLVSIAVLILLGVGIATWALVSRTKPVDELEQMLRDAKRLPVAEARGVFATVEKDLQIHVKENPDDTRLLILLARVLAGQRKHKECAETLERVPDRSSKKLESLYRAGQAWYAAKYRRKAEAVWKAASLLPMDDMSLTPIRQDVRRGNIQGSRRELCKIYAMEKRRGELWKTSKEMYEAALPRLKYEPLLMRIRYQFEIIEPAVCLADLEPALNVETDEYYTRRAIGLYMLEVQRSDEARELLFDCTRRAPEDILVWESWLHCLNKTADIFRLSQDVKTLPKSAESSPECWKFKEVVSSHANDLETAEQAIRKAVELAPALPVYRHRLGQVLARAGKREESERVIAEWKEVDKVQKSLRDYFDVAAASWTSSSDEEKTKMAYNLATAHESLKQLDDATAWYNVALVHNPAHPLSIIALQRLRSQAGSNQ